jgi:hypothetical protein
VLPPSSLDDGGGGVGGVAAAVAVLQQLQPFFHQLGTQLTLQTDSNRLEQKSVRKYQH